MAYSDIMQDARIRSKLREPHMVCKWNPMNVDADAWVEHAKDFRRMEDIS